MVIKYGSMHARRSYRPCREATNFWKSIASCSDISTYDVACACVHVCDQSVDHEACLKTTSTCIKVDEYACIHTHTIASCSGISTQAISCRPPRCQYICITYHIYIYISVYMYICTLTYKQTHIHKYIHTHTHTPTYTHTYLHAHLDTCIHT